jgi:hypothetical protein
MLEKEMVRAVLWIFLPIAIVLLSIVIVVSIDAIITYLKKRDEEARKEREEGFKCWVVAFCEYEDSTGRPQQKEWYLGTETLHHEPRAGDKLCGFGYNEETKQGELDQFFYPVGTVKSVCRTIGLGPDGQEAVVMVEFDSRHQIDMFAKTVVGFQSVEIVQY